MFFDWLMTSCSIFIHCKFYMSTLGLKNVPRDTDLVTYTCNYGIGVQKWHRWELLTWRNFLLQNEIKYDLYDVGKEEDNLGCGPHLLLYLKQVSSVMIHCWPCQASWPVSFQGFPVFTSHPCGRTWLRTPATVFGFLRFRDLNSSYQFCQSIPSPTGLPPQFPQMSLFYVPTLLFGSL